MKRLYVITYKIYYANKGAFKYAENPKYEERTEKFTYKQRSEWIERYLDLTKSDKDLYIEDVKTYYGDLKEITDMKTIIEAI